MKKAFSVHEVLAMGIAQEHAMIGFYSRAARRTRDKKTRQILTDLAVMERDHEIRLIALREKMRPPGEKTSRSPDAETQVAL